VLGAFFVIALVAGPGIAGAEFSGNDPSAERAKVRKQRASVAGEVNALKATDAQVDRALRDLQANVAGQQALLAEAQRAATQAEAAHAEAVAAVQAKEAEIEALRVEIRKFAVEAFVHPPGDDALAAMDTEDPGDAAERRAMLELQNRNDADLLDRLSAAQEDLEVSREQAKEASDRASAKRADVSDRLDELEAARDQQSAFADQVQSRLDHALSEAASLAELDAQLSRQIYEQEIARARRAGPGSGAGGGGGPIGNVDLGTASCPGGGRITVAASIVDRVQSLLNAASSDGVQLCGGGYRSSQGQIEARKRNGCPDVYSSPPSSCATPTARPGQSMHERGLAIDFTCNGGGVISSRESPCYQWLASHAGSYGLRNLPSEPWHWSTNGN
jgi:LAS superfamily LD-carboxypeptidase LdcB